MRARRVVLLLLGLAGTALLARGAWLSFLAFLLWRGEYARLERYGGEGYFTRCAEFAANSLRKKASCRDGLSQWATRHYRVRFPSEGVYDLAVLPHRELLLLLRRTPDAQARDYRAKEVRLVSLNLSEDEALVAESEPFDLNACGFDLEYFSAWEGPTILVHGGGTGESALLFRRQGNSMRVVPCQETKSFFSCWTGIRLVDLDGDGIPEVRGCLGKWTRCPTCNRDGEANVVTWKFVDGAFRKWTVRGEDCGLGCEFAWSSR